MQEPIIDQPEDIQPSYTGLDSILHRVGGENRYQFLSFVIFSLQWFCISWVLTGGGFFLMSVNFSCPQIKDAGQCQNYVCSLPESEWKQYIDPQYPKTIPIAFHTIYACNKDVILTVIQSLVYIGSFIGFFIFPHLADNYGRKISLNLAWASATLGVILVAAAQNIQMVGIGWFLTGFGGNPAITLSYSFINEQCIGKRRQYYSVGIQLSFAVGESLIGLIFKEAGDWRLIAYVLVGVFAFTGLTQIYLVETPKFMIKKNLQATLEIYNSIARKNRKDEITMQDINRAIQQEPSEAKSSSSILDLFRYKSLLWPNLVCGFTFFAIQLVYYCTTFNLESVGYSIYLNQQIIGIAEFIGYLSVQILIPRVKRKNFSFIGMGGSSIICFALISVEGGKSKIISLIMLCAMRILLCSFWALFYVYIGQLFPTKVRSLAFGFSSACGTIGSTAAPYVVQLSRSTFHMSSWIIPGAAGILATICIFPLRQTFNVKLQDDIEQTRSLTRQSQISSEGSTIQ